MQLKELLNELHKKLHIEDSLKAYLYNNHIEICEYTEAVVLENNQVIDDFLGHCLDIIIKNNKIVAIDNKSFSFLTSNNKDIFIYLANLINTDIEDYDLWEKLPDKRDERCITIE